MSQSQWKAINVLIDGIRLDKAVAQGAGLGRRQAKEAFDKKLVRVDGRYGKPSQKVYTTTLVEIADQLQSWNAAPAPQDVAIEILFSDHAMVAVNKPAHLPCHPLRGESDTVAARVLTHFPNCADAGEIPREAGLVHRLDTDTTGVLLFARSKAAYQNLRQQFHEHTVKKNYLGFTCGAPRGIDNAGWLLQKKDRSVVTNEHAAGALPAHTEWQILQRFQVPQSGENISKFICLVECTIRSGRMHQVRAHLADAGSPLLGDGKYGGNSCADIGLVAEPGHYLHASKVTLDHPTERTMLCIEAPLPSHFIVAQNFLRDLQKLV